jgi:hypothetical protein
MDERDNHRMRKEESKGICWKPTMLGDW